MTYNEFKTKWLGKGIDYDMAYKNQCMDCYRMYVKEVLNVPQSPPVAGAKNVWDTYLPEYFDRIPNTPDGVPEQGCIAIWGHATYGHIGIADSADKQYLTCFEQNWTEGGTAKDGQGVTELRRHTYVNVLGWLKPKQKESSIYRGYDLSNNDSMKIAVDKLCDILDGKYILQTEHSKIITELDAKSTESAQIYGKEKSILEEKIRTLEEIIKQLQDTEHSWSDTADVLERKLAAVLGEFAKVGVLISIESDEAVMVGAISQYLTQIEANAGELLNLSSKLKTANTTIAKLNQIITDLKKKETAFRTVNLPGLIIKFYKK